MHRLQGSAAGSVWGSRAALFSSGGGSGLAGSASRARRAMERKNYGRGGVVGPLRGRALSFCACGPGWGVVPVFVRFVPVTMLVSGSNAPECSQHCSARNILSGLVQLIPALIPINIMLSQ